MPTTIFTSPWEFAITCVVLIVAQIVYVLLGFGSGLVSVGALALVFPELQDVVVLLLLVNLPAELFISWQSRREIRWRPILGLGSGIAVGIPVGAILLSTTDPQVMLAVLGWFLIGVGLLFIKLPPDGRFKPHAAAAPSAGLISGVLTGLYGTGGPPLIVWYHLSAVGKSAFRANLMTIFLLMAVVRVPSYAAVGLVTGPRLWSSLLVMPAVLLGGWIGHRLHVQVSERTFRRLVSLVLAVIGAVLLIRQ
ncbi:MAG: sulfite exporter TauE/SafE family protein [Candidatus Krumholzibacteria bacterium]|nr:sulfite exporter TauE/SafE family protein [Candidatus Krumholzibacteria bacterium]